MVGAHDRGLALRQMIAQVCEWVLLGLEEFVVVGIVSYDRQIDAGRLTQLSYIPAQWVTEEDSTAPYMRAAFFLGEQRSVCMHVSVCVHMKGR